MPINDYELTFGLATINPRNDILYSCSWKLWYMDQTLTIGTHGIDDGDHIKIAWRDVSDWKRPQFQKPKQANYTTIFTSGNTKLEAIFGERSYIRPWRLGQVLYL
ncbi:MAG: hypothetical protein JSV04_01150 [Candidatus Heimdallarchaeota archaeon]|nr:MAG: hypothetical protein JSV04_01150 [Candidatus Heimdallarchaeota archaeon]